MSTPSSGECRVFMSTDHSLPTSSRRKQQCKEMCGIYYVSHGGIYWHMTCSRNMHVSCKFQPQMMDQF